MMRKNKLKYCLNCQRFHWCANEEREEVWYVGCENFIRAWSPKRKKKETEVKK